MPAGDSPILVTGGTGSLGRPTVALLRSAGHDVRVLSRTAGEDRIRGDLNTGEGLAEAMNGVAAVLHLANGIGREAEQTRRVAGAATAAGAAHLVYISIVGIDGHPLSYYRRKVESEEAVRAAGVPWTILRATQFHDFVPRLAGRQERWWLPLVPRWRMQPIDVGEVAARLVELVEAGPSGRVPDIEGPEQGTLAGFAEQLWAAHGRPRRAVEFTLPGAAGRALRDGAGLGRLPGYGRRTFGEWVAASSR